MLIPELGYTHINTAGKVGFKRMLSFPFAGKPNAKPPFIVLVMAEII